MVRGREEPKVILVYLGWGLRGTVGRCLEWDTQHKGQFQGGNKGLSLRAEGWGWGTQPGGAQQAAGSQSLRLRKRFDWRGEPRNGG